MIQCCVLYTSTQQANTDIWARISSKSNCFCVNLLPKMVLCGLCAVYYSLSLYSQRLELVLCIFFMVVYRFYGQICALACYYGVRYEIILWVQSIHADSASGQIEAVGRFAYYRWCEMAWGDPGSSGVLSVSDNCTFTYYMQFMYMGFCVFKCV